jgi:hypothetical protein
MLRPLWRYKHVGRIEAVRIFSGEEVLTKLSRSYLKWRKAEPSGHTMFG